MAVVNSISKFDFPYDVYNDKNRFHYISTKERCGFYDSHEKKFISSLVFYDFLDEISPRTHEVIFNEHLFLEKTKVRIRNNMSIVIKRPSESYCTTFLKYVSNRFLRSVDTLTLESAILFVDIVDSTSLALKLSSEEMSALIRTFSQEMAILISKHNGFVLKFAGDAVIGYFPNTTNIHLTCENALMCSKFMHKSISTVFEKVLHEFGLKPLQIRVGIEFGKDNLVFFGSDGDLIGSNITTCSKIYPLARPCHTAIGHKLYEKLNKNLTENFIQINNGSNFIDPTTKKHYECYVSK